MDERATTERLVYVETEDGISQCGVFIRPAGRDEGPTPVIWIHGAWMHFYFPTYVQLGRELASRGVPFLSVNTRGHDLGSLMFRSEMEGDASEFIGARVGGYLWEVFDDQFADIRAWVDLCVQLGYRGVVLAGHSLGATRVVRFLAQAGDERVRGVIAASPAPMQAWEPDAEQAALAEEMVAAGRADAILEPLATNPVPLRRTAQNFLSVTEAIQTFDGKDREPDVAAIACPLLLTLGDGELWNGTPADLEAVAQRATGSPRVETRIVAGSQHNYRGHESELADIIAAWLEGIE